MHDGEPLVAVGGREAVREVGPEDAVGEQILVTVRAVLRDEVMMAPSVVRRLVERFVLPAPRPGRRPAWSC